ncbi:DUF937 domain-containing protein [Aerococcaceae bacterium DSM 111021]|nr:DUF937 domain-containing protein [Aerococcaceae bacterium DSM 111021]
MSLFDNATNLFDMFVSNDKSEEQETLANRAGLSTSDFSKIAALGLPAILQGINRNTNDEAGSESFNSALKQHEDVEQYSSINQLSSTVDTNDGDNILSHVFGNKDGVVNRISNTVGLSSGSVKKVLVLLAPIVMKYFADRKKKNNLDKTGVQQETGNVIGQLTESVQSYNKNNSSPLDIGGMLGGLFGNDSNKDTASSTKEDDSLLDNVFDMFK